MAGYVSFTFEHLQDPDDEDGYRGCKCCRFSRGADLPIPKDLGVEEIKDATKHFSLSIFKDWTKLNAIVKRFEAVLQRRWIKKSLKQRRELLLKAWPRMSNTHRPDFESLRSRKQRITAAHACRPEACLWPYVNLEDLQQRNLLLHFLNSRGRHLPETFRPADFHAAHLGDGWNRALDFAQSFEEYCCPDHYVEDFEDDDDDICMLFEEKHSPVRYGRLITQHAKCLPSEKFKYLRRAKEGLLSLEIQNGLYGFLLRCAKLILHDFEPAAFFTAPTLPEPPVPGLRNADEYASISLHSLEAPYRVPQILDLERLKVLVSSRRAAAEDHIWLLKEDPSYFMDTIREFNEHSRHRAHGGKCVACWRPAIGFMLGHAFETYVYWDAINRKLSAMPPIQDQLIRANGDRVRLAKADENRWAELYDIVTRAVTIPMSLLRDGVPTSPRLRNRYQWDTSRETPMWVMSGRASELERRIDILFYDLLHKEQRDVHGLGNLCDEMQYMLDTNAEASQFIDPWIAGLFSDIALGSEMISAIDRLAPWFDEQKANLLVERHMENEPSRLDKLIYSLQIGYDAAILSNKALLFDPQDKDMLEYPAEKRRTQQVVDQMILAEKKLDRFWSRLERDVKAGAKISLEKTLNCRSVQPRQVHRTQPFEEECPGLIPASSTREPRSTPEKNFVLGDVDPNTRRGYDSTPPSKRELYQTPVKVKPKTRGTPAAPDPRRTVPLRDAPARVGEDFEKIAISKRAYRVFEALLPSTGSAQEQRSEIGWEELLFAMNAIGMQPIKLYGSVWMFSPVQAGQVNESEGGVVTVGKLKLERSIQFHEPKAVRRGNKLPRAMVRTFGRRLRHAYGWTSCEDLFTRE